MNKKRNKPAAATTGSKENPSEWSISIKNSSIIYDEIQQALIFYSSLGFDALPLTPNSKKCKIKGWQNGDPEEMWKQAEEGANIGIRAGGKARVAILDFDDKEQPGTSKNGLRWLSGLGLDPGDYPLVKTASGVGSHVYVRLEEFLEGAYLRFSDEFGAGEFRYGEGAYVVAPPSIVNGKKYQVLSGSFENIPTLMLQDLSQIVDLPKTALPFEVTHLQQNKVKRIPKSTLALLKGIGVEKYHSRSEAEQAILTGLVNKGFTYEETLQLFIEFPAAGKFKGLHYENPSRATSWLRRSFGEATRYTRAQESRPRQLARYAKEWAQTKAWPGNSGLYDQIVFIAHTEIAFQAGRYEYAASARDLAKITRLTAEACSAATRRLCEAGLLKITREWVAERATRYQIESQSLTLPHRG